MSITSRQHCQETASQFCKKSNLHKVHDVCPSLKGDYEEDGDPGKANVVEGDGPVKWVGGAGRAFGVVLVPVHAPILVLRLLSI